MVVFQLKIIRQILLTYFFVDSLAILLMVTPLLMQVEIYKIFLHKTINLLKGNLIKDMMSMARILCGMLLKYSARSMVRKVIQPTNGSCFMTFLLLKLQAISILVVLYQLYMHVIMEQQTGCWTQVSQIIGLMMLLILKWHYLFWFQLCCFRQW